MFASDVWCTKPEVRVCSWSRWWEEERAAVRLGGDQSMNGPDRCLEVGAVCGCKWQLPSECEERKTAGQWVLRLVAGLAKPTSRSDLGDPLQAAGVPGLVC